MYKINARDFFFSFFFSFLASNDQAYIVTSLAREGTCTYHTLQWQATAGRSMYVGGILSYVSLNHRQDDVEVSGVKISTQGNGDQPRRAVIGKVMEEVKPEGGLMEESVYKQLMTTWWII